MKNLQALAMVMMGFIGATVMLDTSYIKSTDETIPATQICFQEILVDTETGDVTDAEGMPQFPSCAPQAGLPTADRVELLAGKQYRVYMRINKPTIPFPNPNDVNTWLPGVIHWLKKLNGIP